MLLPGNKKLRRCARARSEASGWTKHANKRQKPANKMLSSVLEFDIGRHEGRLT